MVCGVLAFIDQITILCGETHDRNQGIFRASKEYQYQYQYQYQYLQTIIYNIKTGDFNFLQISEE